MAGNIASKTVSICMLALGVILMLGFYIFEKPEPITFPKDVELITIQKMGIRAPAKRFNSKNENKIQSILESAIPLRKIDAMKMEKGNEYFVTIYIYEDGTKKICYFFTQGETLYVETGGNIYTGINDLFDCGIAMSQRDMWYNVLTGIRCGSVLPAKEAIEYAVQTDCDIRYQFYCLNQKSADQNNRNNDLEDVETELRTQNQLYNYALEKGYRIPEAEYIKITEKRIAEAKKQDNYPQVEQIYEASGTTLESYMRKMSECIWYREETINYLIFCIRQKYITEGEDSVNGVVFDSTDKYQSAYFYEIIDPEISQKSDLEFEKNLADAERFWNDSKSSQ